MIAASNVHRFPNRAMLSLDSQGRRTNPSETTNARGMPGS